MTIKLRRDTAANWASEDPTLADGEPGLDETNRVLKIGDGSTAWSSLDGFSVDGDGVYRSGGTDVAVADGGTGASDAPGARTNLGLVIGTDVAPAALTIPSDKTADYAIVAADADSSIGVDSATAKNVTVPLNATSAFPVGRAVEVRQVGAGQVTLVPESGSVILRSAGGALKTRAQYSAVSLLKVATNTWSVTGDCTA